MNLAHALEQVHPAHHDNFRSWYYSLPYWVTDYETDPHGVVELFYEQHPTTVDTEPRPDYDTYTDTDNPVELVQVLITRRARNRIANNEDIPFAGRVMKSACQRDRNRDRDGQVRPGVTVKHADHPGIPFTVLARNPQQNDRWAVSFTDNPALEPIWVDQAHLTVTGTGR